MTAQGSVKRDWLAELRATDTREQFASLVREIAKLAPGLEAEVREVAAEFNEGLENWTLEFFASRQREAEAAKPYTIRKRPLTGAPSARKPEWDLAKELDAAIAKAQPTQPEPVAEPAPKAPSPWPDAPLPPPGATAIERLTYPRGLLGHVVQYIYDTDQLPDRTMALVGALCVLAKALDRKVLGPRGVSLVLFILLIAETGAGKQHILNCIRILLRAMNRESVIVGSGIASMQSIEEILEGKKGEEGKPSALVVIDEYGSSFLRRISSKGQTGNVSEIPSTLQTLWGWSPTLEWQGSIKVGKEVVTVHGPAFSIFGSSTESAFFTALKGRQVSAGFVNRHLLLNAGRGAPRRVEPKYDWQQCPEWLVKALKGIAGKPAPVDNRPLRKGLWVVTDFRKIGWGPGAHALWQEFENEIRDLPTAEREVWIRAPEIALRCATIVAAFRGPATVVEVADLEWAIALARHSTTQLARGLDKHMLEEFEVADLVEHIREEFRRKGELTLGQIRKLCERKVNDFRKIDLAIDHLVKVEHIVELEEEEAKRGRPTRRWKWIGPRRG
jgi:hypothetical protein